MKNTLMIKTEQKSIQDIAQLQAELEILNSYLYHKIYGISSIKQCMYQQE